MTASVIMKKMTAEMERQIQQDQTRSAKKKTRANLANELKGIAETCEAFAKTNPFKQNEELEKIHAEKVRMTSIIAKGYGAYL